MSEVEDATIRSSESSIHASVDSPKLDSNLQMPAENVPEDAIKNKDKLNPDPLPIQTRAVTRYRYTKEQLLALRYSPLVVKPSALPPINTWFNGEPTKKEGKKNHTDGSQENERSNNLGEGLNKSKEEPNLLGIQKSPSLGISKSPNGSQPTSPRAPDNIVLGPPKMNFASSSIGGLKNTNEDKSTQVRAGRSEGLRQRQEDVSFPRTGGKDFEPRAPRGPSGGRGFVGREALRDRTLTEKPYKESTGLLHHTHGGRGLGHGHSRPHETNIKNNRRDGNIGGKEHLGRINYSRHQQHQQEERSETPEWLNYNPQTDEDSKNGENGEFEDKKYFDIQAWKSQMKEQDRERKDKEKTKSEKEKKDSVEKGRARSVSRADSSISWRPENKVVTNDDSYSVSGISTFDPLQNGSKKNKNSSEFEEASNVDQLFGPGGIDLNATLDPGSSAFNKFLSQHNKLAMAEDNVSKVGVKSIETNTREQGTSRFARFFTNNSDESPQENDNPEKNSRFPISTTQSSNESKPVPITLDTLFQSSAPPTTAPLSPRIKSNDGAGTRMLTEDEVLQTLGAKPKLKPEIKERNHEDEAAMFKIIAALKKGPSTEAPRQPPSTLPTVSTVASNHPQDAQHSVIPQPGLPFNDPSIISAQKSNPMIKTGQPQPKGEMSSRNIGFSELPASDSVKKINMLFGGNVPTSVYRQLSSRSDNSSRESSTASSPALKFNTKPIVSNISNISNFPNSPQSSAPIHDIHAPTFKSTSPRSPVLSHQQSHNHSSYHNIVPPYSNGPNISQHSHNRQEFPPSVGRNIPVEQLFNMMPPRNVPQQIHPQFQQPPMPASIPPPLPYGFQHQPERFPQQLQFNAPPIPQHLSVHHHPGMLPPGTEALFANMHGYAQFIPNLVNNAMTPNNIPGIPNNSNIQQRGMMTLEEIERRGLGGR
ncbi:3877_t:CDS:2 [Diversispora eburnea]|uniref:3877_t:CDS:1 n=1 Tax=Diversispora eburnea TaxID=1213867 RepID=A0A9N8VXQ9_9GLOM|nr:3877_t:CDS:2 [Diversispora eburnea]